MVREGYKQTEVGAIPEDWDYDSLQDKVDLMSGRHILAQKYNSVGIGTPYLTGPADFKDGTSIVSKWTEEKGVEAEYGNVLITVKGSGAGSSFNLDLPKAVISRQLMALKGKKIFQNYLFYIIKNKESELSAKAVGNLIPGLSRTDICTLKVLLPSSEEQRSIAQALSAVDALIAALYKLIAKKRNLKTATMQQLLTGKKRLPGFGEGQGYKQTEVGVIPEDWNAMSIKQLGTVIRGASPRPKGDKRYYGGDIPRLMVEDVTRDGKFVTPSVDFLTEEGAKRSRPCPRGTLTLVCSGTVGIPSFLAINACIHDGFLALVDVNKKVDSDFLYHFLKTQQSRFDNSATHGGVFTNLTTKIFRNFKVPLPLQKKEQSAIATVLSDMDAEIAALETRLAKTQALKQGMMQELLTGMTRLIDNHPTENH